MLGELAALPFIFRILYRQIKIFLLGKKISSYGGHHAVTRSVVEGIANARLPANYNPRLPSRLAERVHVLSGVQALRQMIRWKKRGWIKQLTCGPNVVVRASDFNSVLASPEIDAVFNHADWACQFWAIEHPELRSRCLCWGAGVDTNFWKPNHEGSRNRILVFDKRQNNQGPERIKPYVSYLQGIGWSVDVLTRYEQGGYTLAQFRSLLHRAALMIGFTVGSESQGIAWAEAWAADVPTLILQQKKNTYQGLKFCCNTAPYLTQSTGAFFYDFHDFKCQFELWRSEKHVFSPREWVLAHMSDEVCARDLYGKLMNLPQHLSRLRERQKVS